MHYSIESLFAAQQKRLQECLSYERSKVKERNRIIDEMNAVMDHLNSKIMIAKFTESKQQEESDGLGIYIKELNATIKEWREKCEGLEAELKELQDNPVPTEPTVERHTVFVHKPKRPLVSIIVPTYNRQRSLFQAIDSVLRQKYRNWELIVVDDGTDWSTRGCIDMQDILSKDDRIQLVTRPHKGAAAARNHGLLMARGDYIAYLDDDDEWDRLFLYRMVRALQKDESALCAYCGWREVNDDRPGWKEEKLFQPYNYQSMLDANKIALPTFIHHRELVKECGPFDISLRRWIDYDFLLRILNKHTPICVPRILVTVHHQEDKSQITKRESPAWENVVLNKHLIDWDKLKRDVDKRKKGLVSIVIPYYQGESTISRCLESIYLNTRADYEVIVVDNGNQLPLLFTFTESACPSVNIFTYKRKMGFALACNLGLWHSKGEYVVFLNQDTEVAEGWLEPLIDGLDNKGIGIAFSQVFKPNGETESICHAFCDQSALPHLVNNAGISCREYPSVVHAGPCVCYAMRAKDAIRLRGFECRYLNGTEDIDLCFRVNEILGKKVMLAHGSEIIHYNHYSPDRLKHVTDNRKLFVERWGDVVRPDADEIYAALGYRIAGWERNGKEKDIDSQYAVYTPVLEQ